MTKITIDAKQFVLDIRAGMNDSEMMEKYGLSAAALQGLFKKMLQGGLLKQSELDDRMLTDERTVTLRTYRCPACKMPQFFEFDECPQCGIIVSKFKKAPPSSEDNKPAPLLKPSEPGKPAPAYTAAPLPTSTIVQKSAGESGPMHDQSLFEEYPPEKERDPGGDHKLFEEYPSEEQPKPKAPEIKVGTITLSPSADGTALTINGLNQTQQQKIVQTLMALISKGKL